MDFDADDPLADLLSEGSNDSFFDEPKASAKRGSLTKTPEKKSISDLFGLNDDKKSAEPAKISDDWLGITRKSPQTVQTPQQQQQQPGHQTKSTKKISFEDDDDMLTTLGLDKKNESKTSLNDKSSDILPPAKLDSAKKSALLESILGPSKKLEEKPSILPETKPSITPEVKATKQEIIKPIPQQKPSETSYGFSSLDAPREGRRRPASGMKDPLGLFSNDASMADEKKIEMSKSIQASPIKRRDSSKTPDWLTQSNETDVPTGRTEVIFPAKGELKTKSVPNLTNIPDWLSNEPLKTHKSDSGINNMQDEKESIRPKETKEFVNTPDEENPTLQSLVTQQKLATSHMEYQNTAIALQQQESQILMTLQLKKYEDNLMEMQRKQQDVLLKQEQQFNNLLERQFTKQQIMENNMRLQQERINNHIQMLLAQPPVTSTQQQHEVEELSKNEELKKANKEETIKLYESIIESLKQRHQEELFLIEESYK